MDNNHSPKSARSEDHLLSSGIRVDDDDDSAIGQEDNDDNTKNHAKIDDQQPTCVCPSQAEEDPDYIKKEQQIKDYVAHNLKLQVIIDDMVTLHVILMKDQPVDDDSIDPALLVAITRGNLNAYSLLFNNLSEGGKEKYILVREQENENPPSRDCCHLHLAASWSNPEMTRFLVEECHFNVNQLDCIVYIRVFDMKNKNHAPIANLYLILLYHMV